jgi:4a-hydroxytetrahydrobiopterin dehydratase
MPRTRLENEDIRKRLSELPGWERAGDLIRRRYAFDGFKSAIAFVNRVATHADELDHHPDILVQYDKVTLTLTTHDAGGLTESDFRLARKIDTP